jgi:hypothetical protein
MTPSERLRYARAELRDATDALAAAEERLTDAAADLHRAKVRYARSASPCPVCDAEPYEWCVGAASDALHVERVAPVKEGTPA